MSDFYYYSYYYFNILATSLYFPNFYDNKINIITMYVNLES